MRLGPGALSCASNAAGSATAPRITKLRHRPAGCFQQPGQAGRPGAPPARCAKIAAGATLSAERLANGARARQRQDHAWPGDRTKLDRVEAGLAQGSRNSSSPSSGPTGNSGAAERANQPAVTPSSKSSDRVGQRLDRQQRALLLATRGPSPGRACARRRTAKACRTRAPDRTAAARRAPLARSARRDRRTSARPSVRSGLRGRRDVWRRSPTTVTTKRPVRSNGSSIADQRHAAGLGHQHAQRAGDRTSGDACARSRAWPRCRRQATAIPPRTARAEPADRQSVSPDRKTPGSPSIARPPSPARRCAPDDPRRAS